MKSTILAGLLSLTLIGCSSDSPDEPPQGNIFLGYFTLEECISHFLNNIEVRGIYQNYYFSESSAYDFEEFWWWTQGYAVEYSTALDGSDCGISEYRYPPIP
jgi:hypothetical protein